MDGSANRNVFEVDKRIEAIVGRKPTGFFYEWSVIYVFTCEMKTKQIVLRKL